MSAARARLQGATALAVASLAACVNVLGLDGDYLDVIEKFCQCEGFDERWPRDPTELTWFSCDEYVSAALARDPDATHAWIATFEREECERCQNADRCATQAPLCIEQGQPNCYADDTCCGFDREEPFAHYCGVVLEDAGQPTGSRCFADDTTSCRGPFEPCESDADCCGGAGRNAVCSPTSKLCTTYCTPDDDYQCPGCCARVADPCTGATGGLCLRTDYYDCSQLCSSDADCGIGEECRFAPAFGLQIKVCKLLFIPPAP